MWNLGLLGAAGAVLAGGAAYDLLATEVLAGTQSSVTFTSSGVWANYQHLQLRVSVRDNQNNVASILKIQFNGSNTGYTQHLIYGSGSFFSAYAQTGLNSFWIDRAAALNTTAYVFAPTIVDILDINSTSKYTTSRAFSGLTSNYNQISFNSGLWTNTDAITTITLFGIGNLVAGSSFYLYGLKGA